MKTIRKIILTDEELNDILKDYKNGLNITGLSKKYGYSRGVIRNWLKENNLYKKSGNYGVKYNWTSTQIENIIELYESGESAESIGKIYGCYDTTILDLLNRNDVKTERRREFHNFKKYDVNEEFFDIINSESKAYWLGFLLADGHVSTDGKIILALQSRDYDHLEKFRDAVSSNHPIHYREEDDAYFLNIGSRRMKESLYRKGFHNQKSLGFDVPKVVSEVPYDLENHFIRGYFDGDGSVGIYKQTHYPDKPMYNFSIMGIKPFLDYISGVAGIYSQIKYDDRTQNMHFLVTRSKKNIMKYKDFMYRDANIFMDRKHDIFIEIERM